jgi:hypothetical protein
MLVLPLCIRRVVALLLQGPTAIQQLLVLLAGGGLLLGHGSELLLELGQLLLEAGPLLLAGLELGLLELLEAGSLRVVLPAACGQQFQLAVGLLLLVDARPGQLHQAPDFLQVPGQALRAVDPARLLGVVLLPQGGQPPLPLGQGPLQVLQLQAQGGVGLVLEVEVLVGQALQGRSHGARELK